MDGWRRGGKANNEPPGEELDICVPSPSSGAPYARGVRLQVGDEFRRAYPIADRPVRHAGLAVDGHNGQGPGRRGNVRSRMQLTVAG